MGQGVVRDGGEAQLDETMIGAVVEAVRPHRSDRHGAACRLLVPKHDQLKAWLDAGLTAVKCHDPLNRQGVVVPERTLHRYAAHVCGHRQEPAPPSGSPTDVPAMSARSTSAAPVRSKTPQPIGPAAYSLIFTACVSRHCFVWVSFTQTTEAVIDGCEAA